MQSIVLPSHRRRGFAVVGLIVALVAGEIITLNKKGDLWVYQKAAERMIRGEEIYCPHEGSAFTYPPLMALPAIPIANLPEWAGRSVWFLMNAAALAVIFYLLQRRLRPLLEAAGPGSMALRWYWILVGLTAAVHVLAPIEAVTHDLFVFLAVMAAIDAACAGKAWRAGVFAGVGAALKATPLLFLPIFLWQRRWTAAAMVAVGAAASTLAVDLLFPRLDGRLWAVRWHEAFVSKAGAGAPADATGAWYSWDNLNQSLAGTLYRLATIVPERQESYAVCAMPLEPAMRKHAILAGQVLVMGLVLLTGFRGGKSLHVEDERVHCLIVGGAIVCGMLLLSPMSSKSHFGVLLVPISVAWAVHRRRPDRWLALLMVLVLLSGWLTNKDIVGKAFGDWMQARGSITLLRCSVWRRWCGFDCRCNRFTRPWWFGLARFPRIEYRSSEESRRDGWFADRYYRSIAGRTEGHNAKLARQTISRPSQRQPAINDARSGCVFVSGSAARAAEPGGRDHGPRNIHRHRRLWRLCHPQSDGGLRAGIQRTWHGAGFWLRMRTSHSALREMGDHARPPALRHRLQSLARRLVPKEPAICGVSNQHARWPARLSGWDVRSGLRAIGLHAFDSTLATALDGGADAGRPPGRAPVYNHSWKFLSAQNEQRGARGV